MLEHAGQIGLKMSCHAVQHASWNGQSSRRILSMAGNAVPCTYTKYQTPKTGLGLRCSTHLHPPTQRSNESLGSPRERQVRSRACRKPETSRAALTCAELSS